MFCFFFLRHTVPQPPNTVVTLWGLLNFPFMASTNEPKFLPPD